MRRGSALIVALWIIAVLSVMVLSFAFEAHQQAGINVYVRERNRVRRLVEPGRVVGEAILLGYSDVKAYAEGEDQRQLDEDDRFWREKREFKSASRCEVGPLLMDEDDEEAGTVTVTLEKANSGVKNGININELYSGGDQNYAMRWRLILRASGIPEDLELPFKEPDSDRTTTHNLMNLLIASWNDWRDEDTTPTSGPLPESDGFLNKGADDGAEADWYEKANEYRSRQARGKAERLRENEDALVPRDGKGGEIPDVHELAYVRGFRDYPAVLTGGRLRPEEKASEDNPELSGIMDVFCTSGSAKLDANNCTVAQLMTIPGIVDTDASDPEDLEDAREVAQAIVDSRKIMPDRDDVDETLSWWPYSNWQDLVQRISDNFDVDIDSSAQQYLSFEPESTDVFKMTIVAESMGMKCQAVGECYVKDGKVRYFSWREGAE